MDYKELLKKYMTLIRNSEGMTYLDRWSEEWDQGVKFSPEETTALKEIEKTLPPA